MKGRLYVCGTPIGNLEDVTLRLLRLLKEVDVIAAEDTRRTRKLLTHHGASGKLISYNEANERKQTAYVLELLLKGKKVALVSDSGMPAISDPGFRIIRGCIDEGVPVEVVPGPSAVIAALAVSGLPTARFSFEGFLPKKEAERAARLARISTDDRTLVFFEAPTRVRETLAALLQTIGDRRAALARELTKVHEEVIRGRISSLVDAVATEEPRGEVVLVVEGNVGPDGTLDDAVESARELVAQGVQKSRAAAEAAAKAGVAKRDVYEALVAPED